ncbi:MAG: hypothetical protein U0R19_16445 [Bryobacteraceae bacterium]
MRSTCLIWLAAFCSIAATAQEPAVTPKEIIFRMVAGGPLCASASFDVTSATAWQASIAESDMATLSPRSGSGNAKVVVRPTGWWFLLRKPGEYQSTITVTAGGASQTIPVKLQVVDRPLPAFTYPASPQGCTEVPDLLSGNLALCQVDNERPSGNFDPPQRGGSYLDPNFGAQIRVLAGPDASHGYSSPSPVSASGKYVLVSTNDAQLIVRTADGGIVQSAVPFSTEGTMWDAFDDRILYALRGATIARYNTETRRTDTVADFSDRFRSITNGGTGELSKDNWIAFYAPNERQICAADLSSQPVFPYCTSTTQTVDFVTIAKGVDRTTGKRYVLLIGSGPFSLFAVNAFEEKLDFVARGPENLTMDGGNRDGICDAGEPCIGGGHGDTYEDSAGNQQLLLAMEGQSPCGYGVYALHLGMEQTIGLPAELGGGLRFVMPLFRCGGSDQWLDFHIGCAKQSPHCALSITSELYNQVRDPADTSPLRRTPYLGEVMVVRDNGVEVRRLAMHRSLRFNNEEGRGYWSTPRAAISADGATVIADSNFGVPNQHRVIAIETGFGAIRVDGVVNMASLEPRFSPGVPATMNGSALARCSQHAAAPLPSELCGTRVLVGDEEAQLLAVSPERIDFLWPEAAPSGDATAIRVSKGPEPASNASVTLGPGAVAARLPSLFTKVVDSVAYAIVRVAGVPAQEAERPVRPGEIATIFGTGLGNTSPSVEIDQEAPATEPFARVEPTPEVYVNGIPQQVSFAGLAPGLISIYQINFRLDPATPVMEKNEIWLSANGAETARRVIRMTQ